MFYLVKTPWFIQRFFFPRYTWKIPVDGKKIFITFDDGPHPAATPFVLEQLEKYNAKATFFCLGKNVMSEPAIYESIFLHGHRAGNHTHDHLNGWKVSDELYFENIIKASKYIDSRLFRPPYGRISAFQAKQVMERMKLKIIMWSVLSGDFDKRLSFEACYQNVIRGAEPGAIIVFHDSEKCFPVLQYVLPKVLAYFSERGYSMEVIPFQES
jgi:peptidoglycan/xylan/chitin deacetylase (PgdA/CDA1 family)